MMPFIELHNEYNGRPIYVNACFISTVLSADDQCTRINIVGEDASLTVKETVSDVMGLIAEVER